MAPLVETAGITYQETSKSKSFSWKIDNGLIFVANDMRPFGVCTMVCDIEGFGFWEKGRVILTVLLSLPRTSALFWPTTNKGISRLIEQTTDRVVGFCLSEEELGTGVRMESRQSYLLGAGEENKGFGNLWFYGDSNRDWKNPLPWQGWTTVPRFDRLMVDPMIIPVAPKTEKGEDGGVLLVGLKKFKEARIEIEEFLKSRDWRIT